jgi:hypothetical protein
MNRNAQFSPEQKVLNSKVEIQQQQFGREEMYDKRFLTELF